MMLRDVHWFLRALLTLIDFLWIMTFLNPVIYKWWNIWQDTIVWLELTKKLLFWNWVPSALAVDVADASRLVNNKHPQLVPNTVNQWMSYGGSSWFNRPCIAFQRFVCLVRLDALLIINSEALALSSPFAHFIKYPA